MQADVRLNNNQLEARNISACEVFGNVTMEPRQTALRQTPNLTTLRDAGQTGKLPNECACTHAQNSLLLITVTY